MNSSQPRASVYIEGIAFWTPAWPSWASAEPALREIQAGPQPLTASSLPAAAAPAPSDASRRPAPSLLAANERRRAPDSVLLALELAQAAVASSGRHAATLASVFTSSFGDLPIVDALCRTLASGPLLLSPTRFHHSVHNAASGYWAIGSGSHQPSTALAAFDNSFAAGWLEAATLCLADAVPVLLVGFDTEACGPLASVNTSRGLLGVALVLAPQPSAAACWRVQWQLAPGPGAATGLRSRAAQALADNALADALPLFEALARGAGAGLSLALAQQRHLALQIEPWPGTA